ncbi:hypothetical protein pb186bvf_013763 [Paramecium bursaria]
MNSQYDITQQLRDLIKTLDKMELNELNQIKKQYDQIINEEKMKHDLFIEKIKYQSQDYTDQKYSKLEHKLDYLQQSINESQDNNQINQLAIKMQLKKQKFDDNVKREEINSQNQQEEANEQLDRILPELRQLKNQNQLKISEKYMKQTDIMTDQLIDSANQQEIYSQVCGICQSSIDFQAQARLLDCHHMFHKQELDNWLKFKRTCPIQQFFEEQTLIIYQKQVLIWKCWVRKIQNIYQNTNTQTQISNNKNEIQEFLAISNKQKIDYEIALKEQTEVIKQSIKQQYFNQYLQFQNEVDERILFSRQFEALKIFKIILQNKNKLITQEMMQKIEFYEQNILKNKKMILNQQPRNYQKFLINTCIQKNK